MICVYIGRLIVLVLALLLVGCAQQQLRYWKADDIARMNGYVRLQREGVTAATVSSERVRRIVAVRNRIAAVAGHYPQLLISDGKEPNASAGIVKNAPTVAINLGMLELLGDDDDAYATILGHEIAHLAMNHGGQRRERESAREGIATFLGVVLGAAGVPMGGTIADVATTAVSNVYTRDEEREADRIGVDYMKRAGFDPKGAVRVWQRMSERSGDALLPFLSTHPTSAERIETMKRLAAPAATPTPARRRVERPAEDNCSRAANDAQTMCTESGKLTNPDACAGAQKRILELCN